MDTQPFEQEKSGVMRLYGLIGYPLAHSFSEEFFRKKFALEEIANVEYRNFPLERIEDLPGLIVAHPDLCGLNVTIPHKQSVMALMNVLDPLAQEIGAVNCIRISREKKLEGFNTDAHGFSMAVLPFLENRVERALVLGRGGAAKAAAHVLRELGIGVVFVTRTAEVEGDLRYEEVSAEVVKHFHLIVNATPVGTFPAVNQFPLLPYRALTPQHILFDMVYNPPETVFMAKGREMGATVINGYQMLVCQAERSWELWNDVFSPQGRNGAGEFS